MSDVKSDGDAQANGQRKTLSRKLVATEISVEQKTNSTETTVDKNSDSKEKKTAKDPSKTKSIPDIFVDAFLVQKDKDGNIKSARISKQDLKALCTAEKIEGLGLDLIDKVCEGAELSDPGLECLTEIILGVIEAKNDTCRKRLFNACISIASGLWIGKHRGSLDLYEDIFEGHNPNDDFIRVLEEELQSKFEKRVVSAKKAETEPLPVKDNEKESIDQGSCESYSHEKATGKILKKQLQNLKIIGVLWLLDRGKINPEIVLNYFFGILDSIDTSKASLSEVSYYLASQCISPDVRFHRIVNVLRYQIHTVTEDKKRNEQLLRQRDQHISRLQEEHLTIKRAEETARQEVSFYQESVENLKRQLENQQLDERASRTHLRDSEGKVRARAFNLLSEDVLEPLKLSLAALVRDNPKTEVAIHQIELVIESIERDLKWFRE